MMNENIQFWIFLLHQILVTTNISNTIRLPTFYTYGICIVWKLCSIIIVFDGAEDIDLERVRPNFCYASIFQVENLLKYKILIFYSYCNLYYLSTTYNNQVTIILLNISVCLVH